MSPAGPGPLAAIILSYGHDEEFTPLVRDLLEHHQLAPAQITVVHNPYNAQDTWTPTVPDAVNLIRLEENLGYAGGMNAAIARAADAEWLLLLTHDARLGEGSVAALLAAGRQHPQTGVVGPRLLLEDGTTWSTGVRTRFGIARHLASAESDTRPLRRDAVDGTILLLRAEMLERIGGFEERFFMYWEETAFCLRARRAGWRVVVAPGATAITRPGAPRRHAVHAYLLTRNGLAFGLADAGAVGVAGQLCEAGLRCFHSLPHPIRRQWRNRGMWRVAADRTAGTVAGAVDFARGRWGKPPSSLRRRSDVA